MKTSICTALDSLLSLQKKRIGKKKSTEKLITRNAFNLGGFIQFRLPGISLVSVGLHLYQLAAATLREQLPDQYETGLQETQPAFKFTAISFFFLVPYNSVAPVLWHHFLLAV